MYAEVKGKIKILKVLCKGEKYVKQIKLVISTYLIVQVSTALGTLMLDELLLFLEINP